jgi:hypothetical protein
MAGHLKRGEEGTAFMTKKDHVYSLRMSRAVREGLKRGAQKERRSVASLLDKLILDYLEKNGLLQESKVGAELRMFPRTKVTLPARATVDDTQPKEIPCVVLDLSLGGVKVLYPMGSEIQVISSGKLPPFGLSFQVPQAEDHLHFHCQARHIREGSTGLQVGAMFSEPAEEDLRRLQRYIT